MLFNSLPFLIFFPVVVFFVFFNSKACAVYMVIGSKLFLLYELECKICFVITVYYRNHIYCRKDYRKEKGNVIG